MKNLSDKPKVFADLHHNSLYNSLRLLFEERLGGQLYRPVGMEWRQAGFWHIYEHDATAAQYLSLDQRYTPIDGSRPLNQVVSQSPDYYELHDSEYNVLQKAITFNQFLKTDIDIIIASIPAHIQPFRRLRDTYKPHAKLIYQVGNAWEVGDIPIPNIMASAKLYIPPKYHSIIYHQEFDTSVFKSSYPIDSKNIYSFVNCFSTQNHLREDWELFVEIEKSLPKWSFRSFGGSCRDGVINGADALSAKMAEARFIWHTKYGGDGYGHVLHNSAAVGRPLIIKEEYYLGKLGHDLLIDGKTCITIDRLSAEEIMNKIEHYNQPELYRNICAAVYENFKNHVDFDREAEQIKHYIHHLI